jgi:hypothetical protein
MNHSRLQLAVLMFPDFNESFSLVDDLQMREPAPSFPEVQAAAANKNLNWAHRWATLQHRCESAISCTSPPNVTMLKLFGLDATRVSALVANGLSCLELIIPRRAST